MNERLLHGYCCSGMLPSTYERLCKGSGIGCVDFKLRRSFRQAHGQATQQQYDESCTQALQMEIAHSVHDEKEFGEIDIQTDARHCWRKNSKDTSVVCIGERSHRVIICETVTKQDDPVSQRHEKEGSVRIKDKLDNEGVGIGVWTHDRNMSINKAIREWDITNQNDVWHTVKAVKRPLRVLSTGPKYKIGKTWHPELADKVESVATHCTYAIKRCDGDLNKLRANMDNITDHYKGNHSNCYPESRCQTDPKYEPSKITIKSAEAEKLLRGTLKAITLYKYPKDFILYRDTFHVESFNNVLNVFTDKRIAMGTQEYIRRSNMAVCHWNENVHREVTSTKLIKDTSNPHRMKRKNVYKRATAQYRVEIWNKYLNGMG